MMSMSPEERIGRLGHEMMVELMKQSLLDLQAWLTAHPQ
jgi:hypothetical protein